MDVTRKQRTIAATAAIEGIGYWSGRDVRVEFRPAPVGRGSSSCAPIWRAARGFRRPWTIASKCRGGPCCGGAAQRGDGRARHGGPGRHAGRQLRGVGRRAGNARLRRFEPAFVAALPAGGHRRAGVLPGHAAGHSPRRSGWATRKAGSRPARRPAARPSSNTNWTTAAATPSAGSRWK